MLDRNFVMIFQRRKQHQFLFPTVTPEQFHRRGLVQNALAVAEKRPELLHRVLVLAGAGGAVGWGARGILAVQKQPVDLRNERKSKERGEGTMREGNVEARQVKGVSEVESVS